jgi:hypothetical protein
MGGAFQRNITAAVRSRLPGAAKSQERPAPSFLAPVISLKALSVVSLKMPPSVFDVIEMREPMSIGGRDLTHRSAAFKQGRVLPEDRLELLDKLALDLN